MHVLRQRLLLVAGWIAAAVGAGVVASGAVAVAGGQVLDQPLRPLTAAEVAALPVVAAVEPEVFEPQASGGFDSTTGEPAEGSEDSAPDRDDPAGTGGSSASVDPEVAADPVGPGTVASVRLASVEGGRASFALEDGSLYLLWATPQAGFVVSSTQPTDDGLAVAFTAARGIWLIEASVVDGEIVITSGREPFT